MEGRSSKPNMRALSLTATRQCDAWLRSVAHAVESDSSHELPKSELLLHRSAPESISHIEV